jgi:hypothetical protein
LIIICTYHTAQTGTAYQLNAKDFDAKKSSLIAKKVGDDLEVALEEGVIIFDNYFLPH